MSYLGLENLLCNLLNGESPSYCDAQPDIDRLLESAAYHGVNTLLYERLRTSERLPAELYGRLRESAFSAAALSMMRERELRLLLKQLTELSPVLLMKGAALAYTVYARADLRPRADTDILIPQDRVECVSRLLEQRGYRKIKMVTGESISSEICYTKHDGHGFGHSVDLHWRLSSSPLYRELLSFPELLEHSLPVHAFDDNIRALGAVHSLLLAGIHRTTHFHSPYYLNGRPYYGANRLIWLYDIHLLGEGLEPSDWQQLAALARDKGISGVCANGLEQARNRFQSHFPAEVLDRLKTQASTESIQTDRLRRSRAHFLLSEFGGLPTWHARLRHLRDHLFPPQDYMLEKYRTAKKSLLPLFYAHRCLLGVFKLAASKRRI